MTVTASRIHTHPTQTCFLSSVDLHTSYPYQLMMPEAIAIVCSGKYNDQATYALTPAGMQLIGSCHTRGFHPHDNAPDNPLFAPSSHTLVHTDANCIVVDLR